MHYANSCAQSLLWQIHEALQSMFCHCAGRLLLKCTSGKLSHNLFYFRCRVICITFVSVSVKGKCFVHNLSNDMHVGSVVFVIEP
jgi:hypothetical protein